MHASESAGLVGKARVKRVREKGERRANGCDYERADKALVGGCCAVGRLCGDDPNDEAAGDDGGEISGMVVRQGAIEARDIPRRQIEVDADHAGAIETEANSQRIPWWVAEQVGVSRSSEEAVHRRTVVIADDDGLAVGQVLQAIPCRIGQRRGGRCVRQRLRLWCGCGWRRLWPKGRWRQDDGDQEDQNLFHA